MEGKPYSGKHRQKALKQQGYFCAFFLFSAKILCPFTAALFVGYFPKNKMQRIKILLHLL